MSVQVGADPSRFENEEFAREQYRKLERQESEKIDRNHEASELAERIESAIAEETVTLSVADEPVEFRPLDGDDSEEIALLEERWKRLGDDEDFVDVFRDDMTFVYFVLGEYSKDETLDQHWWRSVLSVRRAFTLSVNLLHEVELTEEEIRKFRAERRRS